MIFQSPGVKRGDDTRRLLTPIAAGYLALLLAVWVLESRFSDAHWLLVVLAWSPQQPWALGGLALAAVAAWRRAWLAAALGGVAALFAAAVLMGPALGDPAAAGGRQAFSILTFNLGNGGDADRLAAQVRRLEPDVVSLQEAIPQTGGDLLGRFRSRMPELAAVGDGELVVLSRHPIESWRVHRLEGRTGRSVLEARLRIAGRPLTVLGTHFFRGRVEASSGRIARLLAGLTETGSVHAHQTGRLLEVSAAIPGPLVVTGDLNLPPRGRLYRELTRRHQDAFAAAGRGFGFTFPAVLPLLRIDYVLAGPGVAVLRCRVLSEPLGSDHRPVWADLAFDDSSGSQ